MASEATLEVDRNDVQRGSQPPPAARRGRLAAATEEEEVFGKAYDQPRSCAASGPSSSPTACQIYLSVAAVLVFTGTSARHPAGHPLRHRQRHGGRQRRHGGRSVLLRWHRRVRRADPS
jgi:hypothetical protein